MKEKIIVHGPGHYLLTLSGIRNKSIFNSVFDYQYGEQCFARLERAKVIGFCMSPQQIMLLVYCEKDWPDVIDQLQKLFRQHNEQCWRHSRTVISDVCHSVFIDPVKYLSKTLLQIHLHPVHQRWVIDAALYPWSSDRYYRAEKNIPDWIDRTLVLNQICKTHHHQSQRYEAVISSPMNVVFDLQNGNHAELVALSQRNLATFEQRGYRLSKAGAEHSDLPSTLATKTGDPSSDTANRSNNEVDILEFTASRASAVLQDLSFGCPSDGSIINRHMDTPTDVAVEHFSSAIDSAMNLVASQFEMPIDQWHNPEHRRQYNRLMPLVVWLLHKAALPTTLLADAIGESDDRIEFWLRSIKQQHPQKLLNKMLSHWQSQLKTQQVNLEGDQQLVLPDKQEQASTQQQKNLRRSKRGKVSAKQESKETAFKSKSADSQEVIHK